jgi:hypothetical protein
MGMILLAFSRHTLFQMVPSRRAFKVYGPLFSTCPLSTALAIGKAAASIYTHMLNIKV